MTSEGALGNVRQQIRDKAKTADDIRRMIWKADDAQNEGETYIKALDKKWVSLAFVEKKLDGLADQLEKLSEDFPKTWFEQKIGNFDNYSTDEIREWKKKFDALVACLRKP